MSFSSELTSPGKKTRLSTSDPETVLHLRSLVMLGAAGFAQAEPYEGYNTANEVYRRPDFMCAVVFHPDGSMHTSLRALELLGVRP